jgi:hypothetical protein
MMARLAAALDQEAPQAEIESDKVLKIV